MITLRYLYWLGSIGWRCSNHSLPRLSGPSKLTGETQNVVKSSRTWKSKGEWRRATGLCLANGIVESLIKVLGTLGGTWGTVDLPLLDTWGGSGYIITMLTPSFFIVQHLDPLRILTTGLQCFSFAKHFKCII